MKKSLILIIAMLSVALVGCQNEFNDDYADDRGVTTLSVSTTATRTSLGEKTGDSYPVYWSEGDRIVVNGVQSDAAVINSEDASSAQFNFSTSIKRPYNITYPYTSTSTASSPKVVFLAEQSYVEGTFASGAAPMCGYSDSNSKIELKHLAGVLRLPVKAKKSGVTLSKVVVTSSAKIAGEFAVNCSSAALTSSSNAKSVVTYTLPSNFTLSTSKASVLHITLPAVEVGSCSVEFYDGNGEKMTTTWNGGTLKAGVVREFKEISYQAGVSSTLTPLEVERDELEITYPTVYGYVKDTNGNPIKGVAVSDGFSVVATDDKGYYSLGVSKDCWYIFISLPAEYEVPINSYGQPCFFKKYPSNSPQYDFTLTPLAGGKEKKWALFTFADPQVPSDASLKRFNNEAIPGVKAYGDQLKSNGINCYGITLGDIISNSDGKNSGAYRDDMRDGFHKSKVGMPVFQVMGNHDNTHYNSTNPIYANERSSTFELAAQREHEDMFGPVNYSFNRGDVHVIGMRDIVYTTNLSSGSYKTGFLASQLEWLKQDLALVPKSKMVVLCVHIQLFNGTSNYTQEVLSLLDQYAEAHVISGHTHLQHNYDHTTVSSSSHKVYEHNTCALCGAWWIANIAGDGVPNGFNVFIGEGNSFTDWYYMGYSKGMNTRDHQMRLYRGNAVTGAAISGSNTYTNKGYYAFNFAEDILLANVYNADPHWTVKVYEDGVYSGDMTKLADSNVKYSALVGTFTKDDPRRAADGVVTSHDMYVAGLFMGYLGRNPDSAGSWSMCYHMYQYKLKNKNASIKVVATDGFGNQYTETVITEGTDISLTKKP